VTRPTIPTGIMVYAAVLVLMSIHLLIHDCGGACLLHAGWDFAR
jgi:hypothetical protein